MRNSDQLIYDYPFFAKIIKWLKKPKKFKSEYRTMNWAKFNPDENITVEKYDDGTYILNVDIYWEDEGRPLDYFNIRYNPNSWSKPYCTHIFFAYTRCRRNDLVSVQDSYDDNCEEGALYHIQHYCYIFMR